MAFDKSRLRTMFRIRLATVSGLPTYKAWENRPFKLPNPSSTDTWLREKVYINSERKTTPALIEATGETRYDIFLPAGSGTKDADDLTKAIAEAFEAGNSLTNGTFGIQIERTQRGNLINETEFDNWSFLPVVIRWRVFTPTTA